MIHLIHFYACRSWYPATIYPTVQNLLYKVSSVCFSCSSPSSDHSQAVKHGWSSTHLDAVKNSSIIFIHGNMGGLVAITIEWDVWIFVHASLLYHAFVNRSTRQLKRRWSLYTSVKLSLSFPIIHYRFFSCIYYVLITWVGQVHSSIYSSTLELAFVHCRRLPVIAACLFI